MAESTSRDPAHLSLVQAFAGLRQTGELDPETVRMMNTPRCGVKDMVGSAARTRRYARGS